MVSDAAQTEDLVPTLGGSALSLAQLRLGRGESFAIHDDAADTLLYVGEGSGTLTLGGERFDLEQGFAALVLAEEDAALVAGEGRLIALWAKAGVATDRHAAMGARETVVRLDAAGRRSATGARSYRVLLGPENGSTRATLFVGYVPPGRAPWHYHLYDEIVWIPEGPGKLHLEGSETSLEAGSAFRLRPRQLHVLENASPDRDLAVVGVFTPAGSPSAAYLPQ